MNLLCALCKGSGSLFCVQSGEREWWICQACNGCGVRAVLGPKTIVERHAALAQSVEKK